MSKRNPDARDIEVGKRVRTFRLRKGLSQGKLGDALGLTFQQVQKYEKGINRIGAGRLQRIAEILNVPLTDFFNVGKGVGSNSTEVFELLHTASSLRLLRAYSRIRNPRLRRAVYTLVERIAAR
jgi:transcriptional regulator with XRE-family HTH domain